MMKTRMLIAMSCILLAPASCSNNKGKDSNQSNNQAASTGNDSVARRPAGAERLTLAVECTAALESVATLFRVMGQRRPGAEGESMLQSSAQRAAMAEEFETRAATIGAELGMSPAGVEARLRQARERLQRESQTGDFTEFAVSRGREADRCVARLPELL
jgi:hypothetical protein